MLCPSCKAESDAWLDYRLPRRLKIASGAAYDDTVRGVRDNRKARYEEWRNTILLHRDLIKRICEAKHQT